MIHLVEVTLTFPEVCVAAHVAAMRRVQNMKFGTAHKWNNADRETWWQNEVISCISEMAVAKHLDHFWCGAIGNYKAADVGASYQVRATEWANGRLILHPEDKDDQPYILARVIDNKVTLPGWVYGHEGKQQHFWSAPKQYPDRLAFFVPNEGLHGMDELPDRFGVT
jgi:hypothetical protein